VAGSVEVKDEPLTDTAVWATRDRDGDVTHGVTLAAPSPDNENVVLWAEPGLIATIAKLPSEYLYALTNGVPDPVTPILCQPGRTNLEKLPMTYILLAGLPDQSVSASLSVPFPTFINPNYQ
jgi:hypothetical protein